MGAIVAVIAIATDCRGVVAESKAAALRVTGDTIAIVIAVVVADDTCGCTKIIGFTVAIIIEAR
jgi:hypothetical protein